jgi:hypothetical protein
MLIGFLSAKKKRLKLDFFPFFLHRSISEKKFSGAY